MRVTIRTNRASAFLAALETLKKNTEQMIEHVRLQAHPTDISEIEKFEDERGSQLDALDSLDDSINDLAAERNRYIEDQEFEGIGNLNVNFKEVRR